MQYPSRTCPGVWHQNFQVVHQVSRPTCTHIQTETNEKSFTTSRNMKPQIMSHLYTGCLSCLPNQIIISNSALHFLHILAISIPYVHVIIIQTASLSPVCDTTSTKHQHSLFVLPFLSLKQNKKNVQIHNYY